MKQSERDARNLRDFLQDMGLHGCESHLSEVTIPMHNRVITLLVIDSENAKKKK